MKLSIKSTPNLNQRLKIPLLGLGTWQAKDIEVGGAVYHALKVGYKHIDTAKIYGNEKEIGIAIRKAIIDFKIKREEIFITTKLWNSDHDNPLEAFKKSLQRLNLEYIDLYLIHWPVPQRLRSWQILQKLIKEKKLFEIGQTPDGKFSVMVPDAIIEIDGENLISTLKEEIFDTQNEAEVRINEAKENLDKMGVK